MSCKCGATVKAGEWLVGITRFQVNEINHFAKSAPVARKPCRGNSHQRLLAQNWTAKGAAPIRQDCGTIEVASDTIVPGDHESRRNNIRRSNALERI